MNFLETIAKQLLSEADNKLFRHCVVLPNRRAGVFFKKYLAEQSKKTIWAPQVITINELFQSASQLKLLSQESIVFELYKLYKCRSQRKETLDNFYFWGEMLIGDFDDIDKYMVCAEQLFSNINDIHNIDERFGGLPQDKIKIIEQFIHNFNKGGDTEEKRDFITNWSLLYPIYNDLKATLREKGGAYEGMIYRDVADNIDSVVDSFSEKYDRFHFIGFNALNSCEYLLMKRLKARNMASFYWDYNPAFPIFKEDTTSGFFIAPNMSKMEFGQDYSDSTEATTLPNIEIIDIPSDVGQTKLIATLLKQLHIENDPLQWQKTAIIPANENILPALLSSIPTTIRDINITMGYPLKMTAVYSLLHTLLNIQNSYHGDYNRDIFRSEHILSILSNPLIKQFSDNVEAKYNEIAENKILFLNKSLFADIKILKTIFHIVDSANELIIYLKEVMMVLAEDISKDDTDTDNQSDILLLKEFIFRAIQVLNEIEPLFEATDTDSCSDKKIAIKLIDRIFKQISVPFNGEPLKGLQIMGILESRSLDFDNIIILAANEGELPRLSKTSSYIPYNMRVAFGLPTIEHQDSIYSYYFSRLFIRAKKVVLIYNSTAEGLKSGEMSRFLLRLKYSNIVNVKQRPAAMSITPLSIVPKLQPYRDQQAIKELEEIFLSKTNSRPLSPSAINDWINCQRGFYYKHLCHIKETHKINDSIDPAHFGTLLHNVINKIYKPYINNKLTKEIILKIKKEYHKIDNLIKEEIGESYFNGYSYNETGDVILLADMVRLNINRILDMDIYFAPFSIISLEQSYSANLVINYKGNEIVIKIGGKIDRIDERNGVWRLIDYKTGKAELSTKNLSILFDPFAEDYKAITQTLIYCFMLSGTNNNREYRPVIYNLKSKNRDSYDDHIYIDKHPLEHYSDIAAQFEPLLRECVESIFNIEQPFFANGKEKKNKNKNRCDYCPYSSLCS